MWSLEYKPWCPLLHCFTSECPRDSQVRLSWLVELDEHFARIFALVQPLEATYTAVQPMHHGLLPLHLALCDPLGHLFLGLLIPVGVVEDDESLQDSTLRNEIEVGLQTLRLCRIVLRDGTAQRDAGVRVQAGEGN